MATADARAMNYPIRVLLRTALRWRLFTYLNVLLTVILALLQIPALQWELSARALIPMTQADAASLSAERAFGSSDQVILTLLPRNQNVFAPNTLTQVKSLSAALSSLQGISQLHSLANLPQVRIENGLLSAAPLLAESVPDLSLSEQLRAEVVFAGLDKGGLVSPDHAATSIIVSLREGADYERVLTAIRSIRANHTSLDTQMVLAGAPVAQAELGDALLGDLARFLPAIALALATFLIVMFRAAAPVLIIVTKLGLTLILTAGAMAALGIGVYVPTLVLAVVILVIAVSDDIYVIDACLTRFQAVSNTAWTDTVETGLACTAPAVSFSALTTSGGFLALLLTDLTAYADFAKAGVIGILISCALTVVLLPAMLCLLTRGAAKYTAAKREIVRHRLSKWVPCPRNPARILTVCGLAVGLSLTALPTLHINDSWLANLPQNSDTRLGEKALEARFGGLSTLHVMIEDISGQSLLDDEVAERVFALEADLAEAPGISRLTPVHEDILRANAALGQQDFSSYAATRRAGGLRPGELAQGDMVIRTFRRYPVTPRLTPDGRAGLITLTLKAADYRSMDALLNGPLSELSEGDLDLRLTPFGEALQGYKAVDLVVQGFPKTVTAALSITFALVLLLFRSISAAFLVSLPAVCTVVLLLGILALTGQPLGIATAMFVAIAMGASIDYAIHLLVAVRNARASGAPQSDALCQGMSLTAPATLTAALAVFGGVSVLLLSSVPPNLGLGLLICTSLVVAAGLTLWLLPALLLLQARGSR